MPASSYRSVPKKTMVTSDAYIDTRRSNTSSEARTNNKAKSSRRGNEVMSPSGMSTGDKGSGRSNTNSGVGGSSSGSGGRHKSSSGRAKDRRRQLEQHQSRSDWTIHVLRPSGARDLYYIHTNVVDELSPRRVPFFAPVLKDKMEPIGDRTSQLSLPADLADIFEVFLDFLYKGENESDEEEFFYNVKHGLALYRIAEHFEIEPLRQRLESFYQDISLPFGGMENQGGDHSTTSATTDMPSQKGSNIVMVDPRGGLERFAKSMHTLEFVEEEKLDPTFILKALKKRRELGMTGKSLSKPDSENISCLVALSIKHYKETVTRSVFYKLAQEEYLPHIDQEAALQLLTVEMEREFWADNDNFSTVQARCIQSLLADWNGLRRKFESDSAFWKTLRGLSPNVLGILLMQSSGTVKGKDSTELRNALATSEARHGKTQKEESRDDVGGPFKDPPAVKVSASGTQRDGADPSRKLFNI